MAVRDQLKKHGIKFDDFWEWAEVASKGSHERLFDSYERALVDLEIGAGRYDLWLRSNWNKPDFEFGKKRWEQKQKRLQDRAMVRLERIFNAYKKSIAGRTR
jgi:hypothetical protein